MARKLKEPASDPAHRALMAEGCLRGLRAAAAFSGLSEQQLRALMDAGALPWFALGSRGDRMIPRAALVEVLAGLYGRHIQGGTEA
jgi:hypothetical protein